MLNFIIIELQIKTIMRYSLLVRANSFRMMLASVNGFEDIFHVADRNVN